MPRVASPNTLVNIIYSRQGGQHFAKRGGQFLGGHMQQFPVGLLAERIVAGCYVDE
jgi:hypothetical protein